jgi:hypothetical protein
MKVCVLVPAQVLEVRYTVASGDPFSLVEEFLLRAVAAGPESGTTLTELRRLLRLPHGVVTGSARALLRAGLIGLVDGVGRLVATPEGRRLARAAEAGQEPLKPPRGFADDALALSARVVVDLVLGNPARPEELPVELDRRKASAKDSSGRRLRPRLRLDDVIVDRLVPALRRFRHQWIEEITGVTRHGSRTYLPFHADSDTGLFDRVPVGWEDPRWAEILREEAVFSGDGLGDDNACL